MIVYLLVVVLGAILLSGPAWWSATGRDTWFAWDYATVTAPFAIWFLLASLDFGKLGLGNLIEIFILLLVVPIAVSIRVFVLDHWSHPRVNSIALCAVSVLGAGGMRLLMPYLPE